LKRTLEFALETTTEQQNTINMAELPDALQHIETIVPIDKNRRLILFLDYDGTLTPIVAHSQEAVLDDKMRATLIALVQLCPIAIISGRDSADLRQRVGINQIYYVGNHGLEFIAPDGNNIIHEQSLGFLPQLDLAAYQLRAALSPIEGCEVERKRFAIAVHYRNVPFQRVSEVKLQVTAMKAAYPTLRLLHGKKILELQPDIPWDKGTALNWLIQAMRLDPQRLVALYLGDDLTDEDAFKVVKHIGVGILVATRRKHTAARYRLSDVNAVHSFLTLMVGGLRHNAGLSA
jgi:trehalose-phosphatase